MKVPQPAQVPKLDPQQVEILGRNLLITELVRAGIEVATPLRDHGIDIIAYVDIDEQAGMTSARSRFMAVPIQMKAATLQRFSLHRKYARLSNLLLVYVWNVTGLAPPQYFALTYAEALHVAEQSGWTSTKSWNTSEKGKQGKYSATKVSAKLLERLEPFRMTPGTWKSKLRHISAS